MLESLKRISGRILLAHNAFCVWKAMMNSIHVPVITQEEAQKNVDIMNRYNPVFQTILSSVEETFIVELYKFFDTNKKTLRLVDVGTLSVVLAKGTVPAEDKKKIEEILEQNHTTIDRFRELRHEIYAHDQFEVGSRPNLKIPPNKDIEALFEAVKEIQNLISKNATGIFHAYSDSEDGKIKLVFKRILEDLESGRTQRVMKQSQDIAKLMGEV